MDSETRLALGTTLGPFSHKIDRREGRAFTTPDIKRVEDLKGKTLRLGRPGSADYSEMVITLGKHFNMQPGKDYKVINA